ERRHDDRDNREQDQEDDGDAVERADQRRGDHASTARPLRANRPRGRLWMNRMMRTRMRILPSTAPAYGSRNLLAMPSENAPTSVPHRLPTPPNTTTMKESMMYPWPRLGLTLSICDKATPARPAMPEPS